jgi:hypothetical protein
LIVLSASLTKKMAGKIVHLDADLDSIQNLLQLTEDTQGAIWQARLDCLARLVPSILRLIADDATTPVKMHIIDRYLHAMNERDLWAGGETDDFDPEIWIRRICRYDETRLIPEGFRAIEILVGIGWDRSISGWLAHSVERITRRIAEDKVLNMATREAIKGLGVLPSGRANLESLIRSFGEKKGGLVDELRKRVPHLRTLMEAAITHHLDMVEVCELLKTLVECAPFTPVRRKSVPLRRRKTSIPRNCCNPFYNGNDCSSPTDHLRKSQKTTTTSNISYEDLCCVKLQRAYTRLTQ